MRFRVRMTDWQHDEVALRSVRHDVFIVEQQVPETLEWDNLDADCRHAIAEDAEGRVIGCARLLPDGHIGRVAVRSHWRGIGVGAELVATLIDIARARGDAKAMLNAQVHALPFYARFGFVSAGEPFDEAGIPHQAMELRLRA
jgi:predicted GNAT family N-acyltransferase